jgi:hypothetical protein
MAPEQLEKPNEVDHRADIYSLGVVFYEMLTGELPLGKFQPPSEKVRMDVRLDEVVLHALEKEPARRYQQVSEVKTAVDTIASAPPSRKPEPAAQPAPSPDRFWRRFAIAGALGVLAMILIPVAAILLAIILPAYQKAHARATAVRQQIEASSTPVQVLGTGTDQAGLLPEVPSSGPFTKTVLLTRATNQLINASENVRTMSVWTDSTLNPSETIAAFVKRGDGTVSPANSLCFVHWQPDHVSTSVSLSWYFGGSLGKGLGQAEAEAAAAQVRDNLSDRPLTLISGKPLELFSVTNASGSAIIGYIEFNRSVPKPPEGSEGAAAKPQATVNIRRFAAYSPSIDYSVKLPAGYALRATANIGQASTHFSQSPKPGDYHSSWHRPPSLRHTADYLDFPAQLSAQQSALETRFQELQDLGPIPVVLGEPYLVFSFTNKANEVFRGYFELIGFPAAGHATNAALNTETRNLQAVNSIPTKGPQTGLTNIRVGAPSAAPRAGFSPGGSLLPAGLPAKGQVDPATGLPIGLPSGTSARINPATGLPAHEDAQAGTHP